MINQILIKNRVFNHYTPFGLNICNQTAQMHCSFNHRILYHFSKGQKMFIDVVNQYSWVLEFLQNKEKTCFTSARDLYILIFEFIFCILYSIEFPTKFTKSKRPHIVSQMSYLYRIQFDIFAQPSLDSDLFNARHRDTMRDTAICVPAGGHYNCTCK